MLHLIDLKGQKSELGMMSHVRWLCSSTTSRTTKVLVGGGRGVWSNHVSHCQNYRLITMHYTVCRTTYRYSFQSSWCTEQPYWILRSGLVKFYQLSASKVWPQDVFQLKFPARDSDITATFKCYPWSHVQEKLIKFVTNSNMHENTDGRQKIACSPRGFLSGNVRLFLGRTRDEMTKNIQTNILSTLAIAPFVPVRALPFLET